MRHRWAAILVCAALFLAACGGDDDDKEPAAGTTDTRATTQSQADAGPADEGVTRAEYIEEADAFCKKANEEAKGLNERLKEASRGASSADEQLDAIAPILAEGYEVQRRSRDEFKEIPYPAADREVVQRLFAAFDAQTALVKQLLDAAEAGDARRFRAAAGQQDRLKQRARALAQSYGFKECGSGKNEAD